MQTAQRSFSHGEVDPALFSRVDLVAYQSGLKTCRNAIVTKQGRVVRRGGTEFVGETVQPPTSGSVRQTRLVTYEHPSGQSYVLEFGDKYMRVIKNGEFVAGPRKFIITAVTEYLPGNYCHLTVANHGLTKTTYGFYLSGIKGTPGINNRWVGLVVIDANTLRLTYNEAPYTLVPYPSGEVYASGGTLTEAFTVESPYPSSALDEVQFKQFKDKMWMCRAGFPPHSLTCLGDNSWTFTPLTYDPAIVAPGSVNIMGTAGTVNTYVITSVDAITGEESLPCTAFGFNKNASASDRNDFNWAANAAAGSYRVYKSYKGKAFGFVGSCIGTQFFDDGLSPNFDLTPPIQRNPFEGSGMTFKNAGFLGYGNHRYMALSPDDLMLAVITDDGANLRIFSRKSTKDSFTLADELLSSSINTYTFHAVDICKRTWNLKEADGRDTSNHFKYKMVDHYCLAFLAHDTASGLTRVCVTQPNCGNPKDRHASNQYTIAGHNIGGGDISFSPEGRYLMINSDGGIPIIFRSSVAAKAFPFDYWAQEQHVEWSYLTAFTISPREAVCGVFSNNGEHIALGTLNGATNRVELWSVGENTFTYVGDMNSVGGKPLRMEWSPDDLYLAIGYETGDYFGWAARTVSGFTKKDNPSGVTFTSATKSVRWNTNGTKLAICNLTSAPVMVFDLVNASLVKNDSGDVITAESPYGTWDMRWTRDGKFFILAQTGTQSAMMSYVVQYKYPKAMTYYQQRLIFSNNDYDPTGVWVSAVGLPGNYADRMILSDSDSFDFTILLTNFSETRHLVALGRALMALSPSSAAVIGENSGVLLPGDVNVKQHGFYGSSSVDPCLIGSSFIFCQDGGTVVRDMFYDYQIDGYRGEDLTVFASHLFEDDSIVEMAVQRLPDPILWVVTKNGKLLGLTYIQEQQVIAWHRHDTDGQVKNIAVAKESGSETLYLATERVIYNEYGISDWTKKARYIERLRDYRVKDHKTECPYLDCARLYDGRNVSDPDALKRFPTWRNRSIGMSIDTGTSWDAGSAHTLVPSDNFFLPDDVGKAIHFYTSSGSEVRFTITAYTDALHATATANVAVPAELQDSNAKYDWALATATIEGLNHLEGKYVSVYGDGYVVANPLNSAYSLVRVVRGQITLPRPYAVVYVGLPYITDIETLEVDPALTSTAAWGKKNVSGVLMRIDKSRGFWAGSSYPDLDEASYNPGSSDAIAGMDPVDKLVETNEINEILTEAAPTAQLTPIEPASGVVKALMTATYTDGGHVCIRQVDPAPLGVSMIAARGLLPAVG